MELLNTSFGVRRRLEIVGFLEWNNIDKFLICLFYVQSISPTGILLIDKNINQNREVRYTLTNQNRVNTQFNPVANGGTGEYDFFFNLISTTPLPTVIQQIANKLKERGIFD